MMEVWQAIFSAVDVNWLTAVTVFSELLIQSPCMTFSEMVKNKQAHLLIYEKYRDYNSLIILFTGDKKTEQLRLDSHLV